MLKTNPFDGFKFSFIQIARLLKKIVRRCPRLVWCDFPCIFQVQDVSFELDKIFCRRSRRFADDYRDVGSVRRHHFPAGAIR